MKKNLSSSRNHRSATIFSRKVYALLFIVLLFFCSDLAAGKRAAHKGRHFVNAESHNYKGNGNITKPGLNAPAIKIKRANSLAGPTISYNSPQNYTVNTAITPLTPNSSGAGAPGYNSSTTNIYSITEPSDAVVDGSGNLYISTASSFGVEKIPAGGGTPVYLSTNLTGLADIAVDGKGDVYIAAFNQNEIVELPAGGGPHIVIGSGFNEPLGVAVDSTGNVYVADSNNNLVKEIPAGGGATITLGSGFNSPEGVAVDGAGNVYVADYGNDAVKMIPAGNGAPVTMGSGFVAPRGVAVDPEGNVFVADSPGSKVWEIPAGGGAQVQIASGFSHPNSVSVDGAGNLYIADQGNNEVKEVNPVGGYFINAIPFGLSFNNTTGTLSGTPTAIRALANYTVTAYNSSGSASAVINIGINPFLLSYSSPQIYTAGTAISPLTPSSSGVETPGYNNSTVSLGTDVFTAPEGIAVDAAGNVYVADTKDNAVKKRAAGSSTWATIGSGFSNPIGVAVDAAGNVYVGDQGNNAVKEIPVGGGLPVSIGSGFASPYGVAVDGSGNVYVADYSHNAIKEILASTGGTATIGSGFSAPCGVAVDAAGNVYVANTGGGAVDKIPAGGGSPIVLAFGFSTPTGVAVDASGNVFVADNGSLHIEEIPVGGGSILSLPLAGEVFAVAVDGAGNVYAAESINSTDPVNKVSPVGGYYISPFLPAGLKFNNATGVLSGTPVVISPATNYTITAYNEFGASSTANINITVNLPQLPAISYNSPQSYFLNKEITALAPSNTGGAVATPGYSNSAAIISSGFNIPAGVAIDAAGDIYVADYGNNEIKLISARGGAPGVIGSGFTSPSGVAVDTAGNVYVADNGNSAVKEIPFAGGSYGTPVTLGSGFINPFGVSVDASGNVYVADTGNGAVKKIPAGGGATVTLATGFSFPAGIAVDAAGNVYVADEGYSVVDKIPSGGGTPVSIGSGFNGPTGLAVDVFGNVFVADLQNSALKEIPLVSGSYGATTVLGSGYAGPIGVAIDAGGNLFISDYGDNTVKLLKEVGGYYINPGLPAGLTFSNTTGIISGTPTAKSPATNYTVTAYNLAGGVTAAVSIAVTANDNLSLLRISNGTVSPAFASGTTSYTDNVANGISSITATPTTADPAATVTVNGTAVTSGTASGPIVLAVGPNTITTIVTARDGVTTKTYTVTLTRAPSTNAELTGINASVGPITPAFSAVTTSYSLSVSSTTTSITVKPVTGDANATIKVNGTATTSGTVFGPIALADDAQTIINIVVTAQDGTTTKTYTLTVTRPPSNNDKLANLAISNGTLSPAFATATTSYTAAVANGITSMTITPSTADPTATITVNGTAVTSGTASQSLPLVVGPNTLTTVVTAQDGVTKQTYTVVVTKAKSANANLSLLKPGTGTLSPTFTANTTGYSESVNYAVSSITITPTNADPTATVTVNGTTLISGTASAPINLAVGINTITTIVTAQNGTTKTYTLTVTRGAAATVASLSNLTISSGTLAPAFVNTTTAYTASVPNTTTSITVTPTASSLYATITVNGTAVTSGTASAPVNLNVGPNAITTEVTAQNGTTIKTYTITVTRASGSNVNLAGLTISNGTLTPAFAAATTSYTAAVGNGLASMTITPTAADPTATITVNGTAVSSGTASQSLPLVVGPNTITTVVTAQGGASNQTYTIVVTEAKSSNANLTAFKPGTGSLTPIFAAATISYTENVPNTISTMTITPTTAVSSATVTINGTAVASGTASTPIALSVGSNTITGIVTAQNGAAKTYTLTVTRAAGGVDGYDPGISVTKPTETPTLNNDGIVVHQAVSPNGDGINDFLQIDNISNYPDNRLMIMNRNGQLIYEASHYDNSSKVFDGHSNKNGQMQLPGTYFYQLDYTMNGITKHKTGFLILKY